ncbi:MAG: PD-(D/E)XK nuclease family protein [Chloroflexota bacterium]
MTDIFEALKTIASDRARDPLAPVTVVAPSHAAALQLRRRLATYGPFAGVRFETLPRVAELLGAGRLAAAGRAPLARPIGDYASERVGRDSRDALAAVGDLPGYARVLRKIFRRLRRGGIRSSSDVRFTGAGHLAEILRLYDRFREVTAKFYDDEDLLEAAADAVRERNSGFLADLGTVYYVPPLPQSAAGVSLLDELRGVTTVIELDDVSPSPSQTFLVAPDPASEAQEIVRMVIEALESRVPMHEIAIFHGAGDTYGRLLREAFAVANVTAVPLPGVPVAETRAGRGVLSLARLPEQDYSRTATIDFLSVAPIREWLPAGDGVAHEMTSLWDKLSREAMITRGAAKWRSQLETLARENEADVARLDPVEDEIRIAIKTREAAQARRLLSVIEALIARLEPLGVPQPAEQFIGAFKKVVGEYLDSEQPGVDEALEEIDQLGTVGALGGEFTLKNFAESLGANLQARAIRPESIGNGVIVADYRAAAGMRFQRVILCGAYEGAFPPGPGTDAILDDRVWQALRRDHPYIEDAATRIERAKEGVDRAVGTAGAGSLTWSSPAYEAGGSREYFPAPTMASAYSQVVGRSTTASQLRRVASGSGPVRHPASPLAVALRGPVLSIGELDLRWAVEIAQHRGHVPKGHPRYRAVESLAARRSPVFSEWEGNLTGFVAPEWLEVQGKVSPTSLEKYATCGYQYFAERLLRLQVVEEPEERQMMDPAERGILIHKILEDFYRAAQAQRRPQVNEAWTDRDLERLTEIANERLDEAKLKGLTGLDIFAEHEARTIRADLAQFLERDTIFRQQTGAVPAAFELDIPETQIAGVTLRGKVDRIDRTPDGKQAWIIDYKSGGKYGFDKTGSDPLAGGTKLQLPTYLAAAADAEEKTALYWFINRRADFEQVQYTQSEEMDQRFRSTLEAIVSGVRSGAFPVHSGEEDDWKNSYDNCTYCDFDRICSRRRDIEFNAKSDDPRMRPWQLVKETASPPKADA